MRSDSPTDGPFRHRPVRGHTGYYHSRSKSGKTTYYGRLSHLPGKPYLPRQAKLSDAKAARAEAMVRSGRGENPIPNRRLTLRQLHEDWRKTLQVEPRTLESYDRAWRLHIEPALGYARVNEITKQVVLAFERGLTRKDGKPGPLDPGSRGLILTVLSQILEHGVWTDALAANPCRQLRRRDRPKKTELPVRVLEKGEAESLFRACEPFPWLRGIIAMALFAGLRIGEILGLRWGDIDFEKGEIHVRHALGRDRLLHNPKGKRSRVVPLFAPLRKILAELATLEAKPTDFVFVNRDGGPRNQWDIGRAFGKARRYAGLSDFPRPLRFHDLRHSFASTLLRDGRDVLWVAKLLGHANPAITLKVYAHVIHREDRLEEAEQRLTEEYGTVLAGGGEA